MTTPTNDHTTTGSAQQRLRGESPFLVMRNTRIEDCGIPPLFDHAHFPHTHFAYAENMFGEEMVLTFDWETNECRLYHADYSWERPRTVVDGAALGGIVLHEGEVMWIAACYAEWTQQPFFEVLQRAQAAYARQAREDEEFEAWLRRTHPDYDPLTPDADAQVRRGYREWCALRGIEPDEERMPPPEDEESRRP